MVCRIAVGVAAFAALALSAVAHRIPDSPHDDLTCRLTHQVEEIDAFDKLPPAVLRFLKRKMDPRHLNDYYIAPRGGDFNSNDLSVPGGPYYWRRFIRAGHSGRIWFLWYEHGGYAYMRMATFLTFDPPNRVRLVAHAGYYDGFDRGTPCALTDRVLDGQPVPHALITGWW